jgi:hypothetical protein
MHIYLRNNLDLDDRDLKKMDLVRNITREEKRRREIIEKWLLDWRKLKFGNQR